MEDYQRHEEGPFARYTIDSPDTNLHFTQFLVELGISLSSEINPDRLLERIVDELLLVTNADGATLYLLDDDGQLHFKVSKNKSMRLHLSEATSGAAAFTPVPMDPTFVSAYSALNNRLVNIEDVYQSHEFNFEGPKKYDATNRYRSKSMLVAPLTNYEGKVIGVMQLVNAIDRITHEVIPFEKKYEELIRAMASYAAVAISNVRLLEETRLRAEMLREANLDSIHSLAMAAETRDDDTGDHVRRMERYSLTLARRLGLPQETAEEISYSSIMHDVGKISIPDHILKKPGKLTPEEFEVMKGHSLAGWRILSAKPFFRVAREVARHHHEKWNGTGYPDGTGGEAIPLSARVVAVVDVWDALTNRRAYKEAWGFERSIEEMRRCAGTHFDPRLIEAWDALFHEGELERIYNEWKG
ncbi:MAG: HD domain-containing protein [Nitrospinae bacterium]|nr:HD domain-containing protein [Nitrospinota bacterium]